MDFCLKDLSLLFTIHIFYRVSQDYSLFLRIVTHPASCLLPKKLRDLNLRIDVFLHPLGIEAVGQTGFRIAREGCFVACYIANRRLRGAVLAVTVSTKTYTRALRSELAAGAESNAQIDTDALGLIDGFIGDIGGGERAFGVKGIFVVVDGCLRAGDRPAP